MDQINADPKGNWYQLARKKIDQQVVHGSEGYSKTRPVGTKSVNTGTVLQLHLHPTKCTTFTI
jgi:hypothetical protein